MASIQQCSFDIPEGDGACREVMMDDSASRAVVAYHRNFSLPFSLSQGTAAFSTIEHIILSKTRDKLPLLICFGVCKVLAPFEPFI